MVPPDLSVDGGLHIFLPHHTDNLVTILCHLDTNFCSVHAKFSDSSLAAILVWSSTQSCQQQNRFLVESIQSGFHFDLEDLELDFVEMKVSSPLRQNERASSIFELVVVKVTSMIKIFE